MCAHVEKQWCLTALPVQALQNVHAEPNEILRTCMTSNTHVVLDMAVVKGSQAQECLTLGLIRLAAIANQPDTTKDGQQKEAHHSLCQNVIEQI